MWLGIIRLLARLDESSVFLSPLQPLTCSGLTAHDQLECHVSGLGKSWRRFGGLWVVDMV